MVRIGCAAHIRRKFFDALDNDRRLGEHALDFFRGVYWLEEQCRDLPAEERKAYRLEHLQPLMKEFREWLDEKAPTVTPTSPIGKAFTYALKQWPYFVNVLQDGRLKIDNNLIENKVRPLALGRKNFLFAGSHESAQRIAMVYTLLGTCAARGINPSEWLKSTLERIGDTKLSELHTLVPGYKEEGV